MLQLSPFMRGALAATLLSIGGKGIYWFVGSPASYHASTARVIAVALQAIVGNLGGLWLLASHFRETREAALSRRQA